MPAHFDLIIAVNTTNHAAEFRLLDAHGSQLAYQNTDFKTIPVSRQHGLFDLRNYLRHYVEDGKEAAAVAAIGVCIAEDVLGKDIFKILWESKSQRTLRVQLPGAAEAENHLAAALARVPWEIARPNPDAPNAEALARAYISALDIGREADLARQDWESALRRLDTMLEVERTLERPAVDIATTRINRANVLKHLGRFGEARAELEACLPLFQNNPIASAVVIGSLAELFNKQGDVVQAITQQRRALALFDQLPDPAVRAISHNNLSNYLYRHDTPADLAEAPRHQLTALIYCLVAGLGQHLQTSLHNYANDFRRAHAAVIELPVPRVAELLADPAFHPLEQWLSQRQIDVDELQVDVDQVLEQVRQAALKQP